jgi:hypothetical protein
VRAAEYPFCPNLMSSLWGEDESGLEVNSLEQLQQISTVIASYSQPIREETDKQSEKEGRTLEHSRSPVYPIPYVYRYNPRSRLCKTSFLMTHEKDIITEASDFLSFDTPNLTQVCFSDLIS